MDNLDTLFAEISADTVEGDWAIAPVPRKRVIQPVKQLKEADVTEYTIERAGELVETGLSAIADLKDVITTGQNPDEIAALSELMNATTRTLEALSKFSLLQKKTQHDKEMKQLALEAKKDVPQIQNNVVIATREEILKQFVRDSIEVEVRELQMENNIESPQIP
jgi:hypothetical protein